MGIGSVRPDVVTFLDEKIPDIATDILSCFSACVFDAFFQGGL